MLVNNEAKSLINFCLLGLASIMPFRVLAVKMFKIALKRDNNCEIVVSPKTLSESVRQFSGGIYWSSSHWKINLVPRAADVDG